MLQYGRQRYHPFPIKVRQAELNFNTGKLELEQLRQQYANESKVKEADLKVKELEFNIFSKSLAEVKRTLDDAQIRSPRKAILTLSLIHIYYGHESGYVESELSLCKREDKRVHDK